MSPRSSSTSDAWIETSYVDGHTARFAYRRGGPRGGTPLLLLNRFRGTIDDWDPKFLDTLADERDVVIVDLPGVGYSFGEPARSVGLMAEQAREFTRLLGLRLVDVLGWSLGGFVAQALTLTEPDLVRRLVIAASKPGLVPGAPTPTAEIGAIAAKPTNTDEDLLYLFFPHTELGRIAGLESLARVRALHPQPAVMAGLAVRGQSEALAAWSAGEKAAWGYLHELQLPVLVAGGSHDLLMPAFHSFALVNGLHEGMLLLYSDAGHAFLFQHAEPFAHQVLNFLG